MPLRRVFPDTERGREQLSRGCRSRRQRGRHTRGTADRELSCWSSAGDFMTCRTNTRSPSRRYLLPTTHALLDERRRPFSPTLWSGRTQAPSSRSRFLRGLTATSVWRTAATADAALETGNGGDPRAVDRKRRSRVQLWARCFRQHQRRSDLYLVRRDRDYTRLDDDSSQSRDTRMRLTIGLEPCMPRSSRSPSAVLDLLRLVLPATASYAVGYRFDA